MRTVSLSRRYLFNETLGLAGEVNEAGIVFDQLSNPVHVVVGDQQ